MKLNTVQGDCERRSFGELGMAGRAANRRAELREALIGIAERRIAEHGYKALTAREVANEAGCSVGSIYTLFKDMEALIAEVNSRTTARLEAAVSAALGGLEGDISPKRHLVALGQTYFEFVAANPRLWSAIFEAGGHADGAVAEARKAEHAQLLGHVVRPLTALLPDMPAPQVELVARSLFAAVHGIVSLGQQRQFMPVPSTQVAAQIAFIVEAFADGVSRTAASRSG
jgi:AcrR family transcriptional regulator